MTGVVVERPQRLKQWTTCAAPIAGEALMVLVVAGYIFFADRSFPSISWGLAGWLAPFVLAGLAVLMIFKPLRNAGAPNEPAPPTAIT